MRRGVNHSIGCRSVRSIQNQSFDRSVHPHTPTEAVGPLYFFSWQTLFLPPTFVGDCWCWCWFVAVVVAQFYRGIGFARTHTHTHTQERKIPTMLVACWSVRADRRLLSTIKASDNMGCTTHRRASHTNQPVSSPLNYVSMVRFSSTRASAQVVFNIYISVCYAHFFPDCVSTVPESTNPNNQPTRPGLSQPTDFIPPLLSLLPPPWHPGRDWTRSESCNCAHWPSWPIRCFGACGKAHSQRPIPWPASQSP